MSLDHDDVKVEYTVKELLGTIKKEQAEGFTRIEMAMAGKADKADVARLEERLAHQATQLDEHGRDISELQQWRHGREQVSHAITTREEAIFTRKQWLIGTLITLLVIAATLIGPHIP